MEEDKKVNWFPNTQMDQKDEGGFNESMRGRGYESITILRDDAFGDREKGWHPGFDTLQVREISQFLFDKFSFAASVGHLPRTFTHYVGELKKTGALDSKTVSALERHISEVEKGTTIEEQQKLFQGIAEYLGQLRMEKI